MGKARSIRQQRAQELRRRCLFCGRQKGDAIWPHDPNSRKVRHITREHLFRESWREKLECSTLPSGSPPPKREFVKYDVDGSVRMAKPEVLFQVVVKPVCDYCNSGWLNDLDAEIEPWIFNLYDDGLKPDPEAFRRWAIKVAVLLSHNESKQIPQPGDIQAVHDGTDIPEWHVFVGHMGHPHHAYTFVGFGPIAPEGGRIMGVTQASWSLGKLMVTAVRLVGDSEIPSNLFSLFRQSNLSEHMMLAEIKPGAAKMPSVALLPRMNARGYMSWAWYFSTNPLSPIFRTMQRLEDEVRMAAKQLGSPVRQI